MRRKRQLKILPESVEVYRGVGVRHYNTLQWLQTRPTQARLSIASIIKQHSPPPLHIPSRPRARSPASQPFRRPNCNAHDTARSIHIHQDTHHQFAHGIPSNRQWGTSAFIRLDSDSDDDPQKASFGADTDFLEEL